MHSKVLLTARSLVGRRVQNLFNTAVERDHLEPKKRQLQYIPHAMNKDQNIHPIQWNQPKLYHYHRQDMSNYTSCLLTFLLCKNLAEPGNVGFAVMFIRNTATLNLFGRLQVAAHLRPLSWIST
jgi:hypothetical protein